VAHEDIGQGARQHDGADGGVGGELRGGGVKRVDHRRVQVTERRIVETDDRD
jgi:hypothetical protein